MVCDIGQDCPQSGKAWLYWIYSCWFMLFRSIFIIRSIWSIRNPFTLIFTPLVNPVSTTPRWSQANGLTWASCQPFGWKGTPYAVRRLGTRGRVQRHEKTKMNWQWYYVIYICIVYNIYMCVCIYRCIYTYIHCICYDMIYAMIILRDSWGCGENVTEKTERSTVSFFNGCSLQCHQTWQLENPWTKWRLLDGKIKQRLIVTYCYPWNPANIATLPQINIHRPCQIWLWKISFH